MIHKKSVEKQLANNKYFLKGFMAFSANRIQFLSERLKIFSQKTIKAKLAYYIIQRSYNNAFTFDKNLTVLADYFGVERPSLSRCISEMKRDGIINLNIKQGKIMNLEALKDLLG